MTCGKPARQIYPRDRKSLGDGRVPQSSPTIPGRPSASIHLSKLDRPAWSRTTCTCSSASLDPAVPFSSFNQALLVFATSGPSEDLHRSRRRRLFIPWKSADTGRLRFVQLILHRASFNSESQNGKYIAPLKSMRHTLGYYKQPLATSPGSRLSFALIKLLDTFPR